MTFPTQTHTSAQELRKISVVLGTLNRRPYLEATIESIRRSVCSLPLEIIVVDGGSTDGTLRWLSEQRDVITIIQHNVLIVDGRKVRKMSWGYFMNLGFKIAQGELICMISDDSVLHPDAIANGVATYRQAVADGKIVGGVAFRWRSYPEESKYRIGYTLGGRMFVNHGFYVRDALEAVGWLEEEALKFYFADGDVCLKLADHGYEVISGEDSYVEHFEIPKQSSPNVSTALIDSEWDAYRERWAKLKGANGVLAIGHFDYKDFAMDPSELKKLIPACVTADLAKAAAISNPRPRARTLVARAVRKLAGKKP